MQGVARNGQTGGDWSGVAEPETLNWFVACTMPRHEKQVAAQLGLRGIEHFLPTYEEVHHWKDRRTTVVLPLFPGYIFVRIPLRERVRVQAVPSVVRMVGFGGPPVPLQDLEMERLRSGLRQLRALPHPFVRIGERVRIRRGPLAGAEGRLQRLGSDVRVVLSMDIIQRAVSVEIDVADLELL